MGSGGMGGEHVNAREASDANTRTVVDVARAGRMLGCVATSTPRAAPSVLLPYPTPAPQEKLHYFRVQIARATVGKPGKAAKPAAAKATDAVIFIASAFAAWQRVPLQLLASMWSPAEHGTECGGLPADALARVKVAVTGDAALKPLTKKVMVRSGCGMDTWRRHARRARPGHGRARCAEHPAVALPHRHDAADAIRRRSPHPTPAGVRRRHDRGAEGGGRRGAAALAAPVAAV